MIAVHVLAWSSAVVAVVGLTLELINLRFFPRVAVNHERPGTIVACIAARNEEHAIAACIDALLDQPQVARIIVCDDGSDDGTLAVVAQRARIDGRIVLMQSPGTGKSAALAAAARAARSYSPEALLFVDADTCLNRGALGGLLTYKDALQSDAVSVWPKTATRSPWDRVFSSAVVLFLLQALPLQRAAEGTDPRFAAANGQLFLVDTRAYDRSGGHDAIASIVEDVALARLLKEAGHRVALGSGADLATATGYGSLRKNVRGYGRSLLHGAGRGGTLMFALWQLVAFALPWLLVWIDAVPAIVALASSMLAVAIVSNRMRTGYGCLLDWLVGGWALAASALTVCVQQRPTVWKGRKLPL